MPVTSAQAVWPGGWQAELKLQFEQRMGRSLLARRAHRGPLVVQKPLYPEGDAVCHAIIVHPPGGVVGGDQLSLQVQMAQSAHALLTTPGAGKWYKSGGRLASQFLQFEVADGAVLEWLPQENILFDGAEVAWSSRIQLSATAVYAGWDILCFGRQASGERWQRGVLGQRLTLQREDRLLWQERSQLQPDSLCMQSVAGLRGCPVVGNFVVAAGAVPAALIDTCREIVPDAGAWHGVSVVQNVLAVRYLGHSAGEARRYFEALRQVLRPWYAARAALAPRVWNT